jgi:hypothetical protein
MALQDRSSTAIVKHAGRRTQLRFPPSLPLPEKNSDGRKVRNSWWAMSHRRANCVASAPNAARISWLNEPGSRLYCCDLDASIRRLQIGRKPTSGDPMGQPGSIQKISYRSCRTGSLERFCVRLSNRDACRKLAHLTSPAASGSCMRKSISTARGFSWWMIFPSTAAASMGSMPYFRPIESVERQSPCTSKSTMRRGGGTRGGRRRHRHAGAMGFVLGRTLCPHQGSVRPFLEFCPSAAGEGVIIFWGVPPVSGAKKGRQI